MAFNSDSCLDDDQFNAIDEPIEAFLISVTIFDFQLFLVIFRS